MITEQQKTKKYPLSVKSLPSEKEVVFKGERVKEARNEESKVTKAS